MKPHEGSELDELPNGNARLTANRMLRTRKILAYIVEKLELDQPSTSPINNSNSVTESAATSEYLEKSLNDSNEANNNDQEANNTGQIATKAEEERNNAMKPELWLELICQDQVIFILNERKVSYIRISINIFYVFDYNLGVISYYDIGYY